MKIGKIYNPDDELTIEEVVEEANNYLACVDACNNGYCDGHCLECQFYNRLSVNSLIETMRNVIVKELSKEME